MPWPPELVGIVQIGRLADNDIVIDDKRVSGHHAQLVIIEGFENRIEDRGSSNGTFLNSVDRRRDQPDDYHGVGYSLFRNACRTRRSNSGRPSRAEAADAVVRSSHRCC